MAGGQIGIGDIEEFLTKRHALRCQCCGRATLAYFEPPNKVVIKTKSHGRWHVLTLIVTLPTLADIPLSCQHHDG